MKTMTHQLVLKVQKFQLSSAERFGTMEEKPPEGGNGPPPILFRGNVFKLNSSEKTTGIK